MDVFVYIGVNSCWGCINLTELYTGNHLATPTPVEYLPPQLVVDSDEIYGTVHHTRLPCVQTF
jgi:hypothetical protein